MDAAKGKNGNLVIGRSGVSAKPSNRNEAKDLDGWTLTPAGAEWLLQNRQRIEKGLKIIGAGTARKDAQQILKMYYKDPAFKKFLTSNSIDDLTYYEFTDFLNCTPDASQDVVQKRFERFVTQATFLEDTKLQEFATTCKQKFFENSQNLKKNMEG